MGRARRFVGATLRAVLVKSLLLLRRGILLRLRLGMFLVLLVSVGTVTSSSELFLCARSERQKRL